MCMHLFFQKLYLYVTGFVDLCLYENPNMSSKTFEHVNSITTYFVALILDVLEHQFSEFLFQMSEFVSSSIPS